MIQCALFMDGLLRRNCRSFQAFVMPGEPSGRAVTVPILCFRPVAYKNVVGDVAVPHISQGSVDLLPMPLIKVLSWAVLQINPAMFEIHASHLLSRCLPVYFEITAFRIIITNPSFVDKSLQQVSVRTSILKSRA